MKNKIFPALSIFTILALAAFLWKTASAQIPAENSATPEIFSEPGAKLLITEVNFKNKEADWVELYYESPSLKPFNLKGFQFQDDNIFKKMEADFWLSPGGYYLLQFKNPLADDPQQRVITTTRTGLTATTEQIILKDPDGKIIDALCWSSATPTADEIKDLQELFEGEGWVSADSSSCFSSAKVSTNQSLIRIATKDTDSVNDWTVTDDVTQGAANNSPGSDEEQTAPSPLTSTTASSSQTADESSSAATTSKTTTSISTPDKTGTSTKNSSAGINPKKSTSQSPAAAKKSPAQKTPTKTSNKKTTTAKKTSSSSKKSATKKYKNGDLSSAVVISEIFPHAAKDDRNNEWIELTNTDESEVNMGNWRLDDMDGGSKPYILPDTLSIPPQSSIVIKAPESKLSLSNAKDQVRLFDHTGSLLQTVEFEEAPKGQSYALINIASGTNADEAGGNGTQQTAAEAMTQRWLWETEPTPGEPNPQYLETTGTITEDAAFGDTYSFVMEDMDGRTFTVLFDEALIAGPLAKATFVKGTTIKILGPDSLPDTTPLQDTRTIRLRHYEVISVPRSTEVPASPWILMGLLPPGGAGCWYLLRKRKKICAKI